MLPTPSKTMIYHFVHNYDENKKRFESKQTWILTLTSFNITSHRAIFLKLFSVILCNILTFTKRYDL